jgi:inosine-uridine nucleoside N-ribohydrolase
MMRKVILIVDPGIDGAFATALALFDASLDVAGIAATAGIVSPEQATKNVQILIEQIDPPRWPRLGAALPHTYNVDGTKMHGPGGLGGVSFPCAQLHHQHSSDKLLIDIVHQYPGDVTVISLGPLTVLARAFDRDPDLPKLIQRLVCVGGARHEPGDAGPVSEFNFFCDPAAARQVLHSGVPLTLIPLDVTRKFVLSPTDLLELPAPESRTCRFLRQIVPHGIRMTSNHFGIEGLHLNSVLGVVAVTMPESLVTKPLVVGVETRGELTRGMTVVDARPGQKGTTNVDMAVDVDVAAVRDYIHQILRESEQSTT